MTTTTGRPISHAASTSASTPEPSTDWRHRGACREVDPEIFFPVGKGALARAQEELAKGVCGGCPVAAECLSWAVETGQSSGVWGGLAEDDRRLVGRRAARKAPAPTAEEGARLAIARSADLRRWVSEEGKDVHEVAALLEVELPVALAAVRALNLKAPVRMTPMVVKVLAREADLRRLRQQGVLLRRCAEHLDFSYEAVRMAWRVIKERDAAREKADAEGAETVLAVAA